MSVEEGAEAAAYQLEAYILPLPKVVVFDWLLDHRRGVEEEETGGQLAAAWQTDWAATKLPPLEGVAVTPDALRSSIRRVYAEGGGLRRVAVRSGRSGGGGEV